MANEKPKRVPATDRSMDAERSDRSSLFFFPKRTPPASIRAASREEAERLLDATNPQEA